MVTASLLWAILENRFLMEVEPCDQIISSTWSWTSSSANTLIGATKGLDLLQQVHPMHGIIDRAVGNDSKDEPLSLTDLFQKWIACRIGLANSTRFPIRELDFTDDVAIWCFDATIRYPVRYKHQAGPRSSRMVRNLRISVCVPFEFRLEFKRLPLARRRTQSRCVCSA